MRRDFEETVDLACLSVDLRYVVAAASRRPAVAVRCSGVGEPEATGSDAEMGTVGP